jgi:ankyrin repeat protein
MLGLRSRGNMPTQFSEADIDRFVRAAFEGNIRTVEADLARGMPVDAIGKVDSDAGAGISALYAATYHSNIALMTRLLEKGANPNLVLQGDTAGEGAPDITCRSALNLAITGMSLPSIDLLLASGADPRIRDDAGATAAHCLIQVWPQMGHSTASDDEMLRSRLSLMFDRGIQIDQRDLESKTLLGHAISTFAGMEVLDLLIQRNANVARVAEGGTSAVHVAAISGNVEALSFLAEQKADINATDDQGQTALFVFETAETGQMLLALGAAVDRVDYDGRTALDAQIRWLTIGLHPVENIAMLLSAGADPDHTDFSGQTTRARAAENQALAAMFSAVSARKAMRKAAGNLQASP